MDVVLAPTPSAAIRTVLIAPTVNDQRPLESFEFQSVKLLISHSPQLYVNPGLGYLYVGQLRVRWRAGERLKRPNTAAAAAAARPLLY